MNTTDLRILIAEDEVPHALALRRMLEKKFPGVVITVVDSILEYRSSIASAVPTIVLMDLNLTDGCTLDLLKASDAPCDFPVVVMSSYASKQVENEALQAGAVDFIIKTPDVFLTIAEIVEKTISDWELRHGKIGP